MTTKERRLQTEVKKFLELQAIEPEELLDTLESMEEFKSEFEKRNELYKDAICSDCNRIDPENYEPDRDESRD